MRKPVKVLALMLVISLLSVAPDWRWDGQGPPRGSPQGVLPVARAEDGAGTTLEELLTALQAHPDDRSLRQRIIERVRVLRTPPPIPQEARRQFVRGNTALQDAEAPEDVDAAIRHYQDALRLAPLANLFYEEPDAGILHVRICGGPGGAIPGATRPRPRWNGHSES